MALKLLPIVSCSECRFRCEYVNPKIPNWNIIVCRYKKQILEFEGQGGYKDFPDWCPLDSQYVDICTQSSTPHVGESEVGIVFDNRPTIEWGRRPLTDHGGVYINGGWYYTFYEAKNAVAELGDGWRLPTQDEFAGLMATGSTWVAEGPEGRPGRWFGGNHATDHEGSLFFPAFGCQRLYSGGMENIDTYGYYWSSTPKAASEQILLTINDFRTDIMDGRDCLDCRSSVVCVRNIRLSNNNPCSSE